MFPAVGHAEDVPNIAVLDTWRPQDWAHAKGGDKLAMVQELYDADIVTDQYVDCNPQNYIESIVDFFGFRQEHCHEHGVPVLEVGQGYMKLSLQDRLRVVEFIDYVYEITSSPKAMFVIVHDDTNEELGIFTRHGLQLSQ